MQTTISFSEVLASQEIDAVAIATPAEAHFSMVKNSLLAGKHITDCRILLLGLAYKKDVDDDRESVTYKLMELLQHHGVEVDYNDPHIYIIKSKRDYKQFIGKKCAA